MCLILLRLGQKQLSSFANALINLFKYCVEILFILQHLQSFKKYGINKTTSCALDEH